MKPEESHFTSPQKNTLKYKIWRLCNGVMAVFFFICVIVQHNDPDPELWMPVYCLASLMCLSISVSPQYHAHIAWRLLCMAEISACLALGSYTMMYISEETRMVKHGPNPILYEEGRELLGLLIVILWLIACLIYSPSRLQATYSMKWEAALVILIIAAATIPLSMWAVCQVGVFSPYITYCKHMCSTSM